MARWCPAERLRPRSYDPGLYIPVDRNIELGLHSADVIHSFWVPKLAGKTDVDAGARRTTCG